MFLQSICLGIVQQVPGENLPVCACLSIPAYAHLCVCGYDMKFVLRSDKVQKGKKPRGRIHFSTLCQHITNVFISFTHSLSFPDIKLWNALL
jgi:hypothetical protein